MNATATTQVITKSDLLNHWQGHRTLTRRTIEKFPETEFFEFSIGGMRTFAKLTAELLAIGAPAMQSIVNRTEDKFTEPALNFTTKAQFLEQWDKDTETINEYWEKLDESRFSENYNLFGEYEFSIIRNVLYFIDNEIHHRGQAFVYLRALGIEPPFFWDRF